MGKISEKARELSDFLEEQFGEMVEKLRAMLNRNDDAPEDTVEDAEHEYRRELLREETRTPLGARMGMGTVHVIEYARFSHMRHNPLRAGFFGMREIAAGWR